MRAKSDDTLLECFQDDYSPWVEIGKRLGSDSLQLIMDVLGGQKIHVPQYREFMHKLALEVRDREIRAKFKGNNLEELALEYHLRPRQVRRIVQGYRSGHWDGIDRESAPDRTTGRGT